MNIYINYYYMQDRLGTWPDFIRDNFEKNFSKHGTLWFYKDSDVEATFKKECSLAKLKYYEKTILKVTGNALYDYPYHYLSIATDKYVYNEEYFLDFSNICEEKVFFCGQGIRQINKVVIDYNKSKLLDIMITPTRKRLILISKKMKDILDDSKLTGFRTVPCLEKGREYHEIDIKLDTYSKEVEGAAKYFQLIITVNPIKPPKIGMLRRLFDQCPKCQRISGFDSTETTYFYRNDLKDVDFQFFTEYSDLKGNTFEISNEIPIISSKTLKILLSNKIKGLTRYTTDPPIQYGVVEIKK